MVIGSAGVKTPTAVEDPPLYRKLDFSTLAWRLVCAFAFSIPFSIFIAQTLLIAAVAAAVADWLDRRPPLSTPLDLPIALFLASSLLAALVGLDVSHSLWGLRTYLQIVIVYLVYAYVNDLDRAVFLIGCFLAGSAITSSYTLVRAIDPDVFPRLFLGQMTQSGQLLFAIGFTAPMLFWPILPRRLVRWGFALYVLALIVNLKRGAWLGVTAAISTVGLLVSRRVLLAAAGVILLVVAAASPVRERITNSTRDLFLPGNRYDIWMAAIDVVHRFPMGVGRKNGEILRDYANIPQHHKHAHNNLLQITLESGYLGLATFLWWMGRFARLSWHAYRRVPVGEPRLEPIAVAVLATFVGFHVAGLVEYNFGDSEVLEAFFLMMGVGLVVDRATRHDR
jgi:O-antigen ligase